MCSLPCIRRPVFYTICFYCIVFVLDTPDAGSHQTAGSVPTHGHFAPPRFSASRPHCVSLWLDGSIIITFACHGRTGSYPIFTAGCSRSHHYGGHGASADVAYRSSRSAKTTYLMNGYSIFKERVKGQYEKVLSPNALFEGGCTGIIYNFSKNFFSLSVAALRLSATEVKNTSSCFAICRIDKPLK